MPASCSSSELSSHQMAIRSHPGVQKMPAGGISSELSAHQMAPAGAISVHGNETPNLGMGCFSTWFQVLPSRFLCSSRLSFFQLQKLSTREQRGVPTQAFGAFLRDVSHAPLPGLLKLSLTVQMYDVYCGPASYGSYVSDLVFCMVMPFSSGPYTYLPSSPS